MYSGTESELMQLTGPLFPVGTEIIDSNGRRYIVQMVDVSTCTMHVQPIPYGADCCDPKIVLKDPKRITYGPQSCGKKGKGKKDWK